MLSIGKSVLHEIKHKVCGQDTKTAQGEAR